MKEKITTSEEALKEKVPDVLWQEIRNILSSIASYNLRMRLVQLLYQIYSDGYEDGYEKAQENVKDWIDLSDFAPDNDWRD